MIKVGRAVEQLNIGEADAEQRRANPVAVSSGNADAEQTQRGKVGVHPPAGPGLQPAKPQIAEVIGRFNIKLVNPSVG